MAAVEVREAATRRPDSEIVFPLRIYLVLEGVCQSWSWIDGHWLAMNCRFGGTAIRKARLIRSVSVVLYKSSKD